jgi:hypothetical protein
VLKSNLGQSCPIHIRQLRATLVQAGTEFSQRSIEGPEIFDLHAIVSPILKAREEHLRRALNEACEGTAKSFTSWVKVFVDHVHASNADAAMVLRQTFVDNEAVEVVLCDDYAGYGNGRKERDAVNDINKAITSLPQSAQADKQERQHQLHLSVGSCSSTALLLAGRQVLEAWQVQSSAVKELVQVHSMLEQEVTDNEGCLQSGQRTKEKDDAIKTRQENKTRMMNLRVLDPVISCEDKIEGVAKAPGYAQVSTLESLRCDVRNSIDNLHQAPKI